MRHELSLQGPAFGLRPVGDADAEFIVALRNDPALGRFLNGGATTVEQQRAWLARYYERPGDYYFVVERRDGSSRPEGLVGLYDLDPQGRRAEWGRWVLRPGSLAAVESAWLIYRCAFETLGLESVYCRTIADNAAVVSFHDSCGIATRERLPAYFRLEDKVLDAIEHRVDCSAWLALSSRLERLSVLTARRTTRG